MAVSQVNWLSTARSSRLLPPTKGKVFMRVSVRPLLLALVAGAFLLPGMVSAQTAPLKTISTQDLAAAKNGGNDWITHGGALNNERYSSLNQITTSNVAQLKGAWMTRLGSGRGSKYRFEADPVVVNGVMYIPTGNDDIFALDATRRQEDLGVGLGYPPGQRPDLLRLGQPRRRRRQRQGLLRVCSTAASSPSTSRPARSPGAPSSKTTKMATA